MPQITGTLLDDFLPSSGDADTLTGLAGNDIVVVAAAAEHAAPDRIDAGEGYDRIWFASSSGGETLNLLATVLAVEAVEIVDLAGNATGAALNVNAAAVATGLAITGNNGANLIAGTAKDDAIDGRDGQDTLLGGLGNDRIWLRVDEGALDRIDAGLAAEGNLLVLLGEAAEMVLVDLTLPDQVESGDEAQGGFSHVVAADLAGVGVRVRGTDAANYLTGSGQDDSLSGAGGADALAGGGGNDTLAGGAAMDALFGGGGDDLFVVGSAAEFGAAETLAGGAGDDTIAFVSTNPGETLVVHAKVAGIEAVEIPGADAEVSLTGPLNVNAAAVANKLRLTGNDSTNNLAGTRFDDTLNGNGGADSLAGGAGNDRYVVDSGADHTALDRIADVGGGADLVAFVSTLDDDLLVLGAGVLGIESALLGDPEVEGGGTAALGATAAALLARISIRGNDGNNVVTGSAFADTLEGLGGDDSLAGGAGNDFLAGGAGLDTLSGGAGSDTLALEMDDGSADAADGGAGLATERDLLKLVGTAAGAVEVFLGAAPGEDQILSIGGLADDPLQSDFSGVDASTLAGAGINATGSAAANSLIGSNQADTLEGGAGADLLAGGGGNDLFILGAAAAYAAGELLDGGAGNDLLRFTPTVAENLTLAPRVAGLEALEVLAEAALAVNVSAALLAERIFLSGHDGANVLTGTAFDDTLAGNGGSDTMLGGAGNDVFLVLRGEDFTAGDKINDIAGVDTLRFHSETSGEELVLTGLVSAVERFELAGEADLSVDGAALRYAGIFLGNDGANTLVASPYADTVEGGKGDDTLAGGSGDDSLSGGEGADSVAGGAGNDTVVVTFQGGVLDEVDAGAAAEGNTLILIGTAPGPVVVDLGVAAGEDQLLFDLGVQSDFAHFDAGGMLGGAVDVTGSAGANRIVGTARNDVFRPGLGADTVEGGEGFDAWFIASQAEYDADFYTDSGTTTGDYIFFEGASGQTLKLKDNVDGVDIAAAAAGTANINIDASAVDHPFGLAGNAGRNTLIGTRHGESFFDYGGADVMNSGGGRNDLVIGGAAAWVSGDRYTDPDGGDHLYFAEVEDGVLLVNQGNTLISGVALFAVSSPALSGGGTYLRDIEVPYDGGIDASAYARAIHLSGAWGNNLLKGTPQADTILGQRGEDTVFGGAGADQITMEVGPGDADEIDAGALAELNRLLLVGTAPGTLRIDLAMELVAGDQLVAIGPLEDAPVQKGFVHVSAAGMLGAGLHLDGNAFANDIGGSAQADTLSGGAGKDTLMGGEGNDVFVFRLPIHMVAGETIGGGAGEDTVWFASAVAGQTLSITPVVMGGIEAAAIVQADGTVGATALNLSAGAYTAGLRLTGNDGANAVTGTAFADTLEGLLGADTLAGGAGNDLYLVADAEHFAAGERISDASGALDTLRFTSHASDTVLSLGALVSGLEVAEIADHDGDTSGALALGLDASLVAVALLMRGNDGANTLSGGAKNDTIHGNGGADSIVAGAGADTIFMQAEAASLDDVDAGALAEGNRLVLTGALEAPMVWDLSSETDQHVSDADHVVLGISHLDASALDIGELEEGVTITGNALANILVGTAADDVFIVLSTAHLPAAERIAGGAGFDTLRLDSTTAGQTLAMGIAFAGIEAVELAGGATALNVNAGAARAALVLTGNDGANAITGSAFADTIAGGAGADTISAGLGADRVAMRVEAPGMDAINAGALAEGNTLVLEGAAAGVLAVDLAAADQVAGALVQAGFTHLDVSGVTSELSIAGTAAANRIVISAANAAPVAVNSLGGGDTLVIAGEGSGTLVVDLSAPDQVSSLAGVQAGFTHFDGTQVTGALLEVTGSAGANLITMDVAATHLADAGAWGEGDTLALVGAAPGTVIIDLGAGPGADQLLEIGGAEDALSQSDFQHASLAGLQEAGGELRGNGLANQLAGSAQEDRFAGLGGADVLDFGGIAGGPADDSADVALYGAPGEGLDRIVHFKAGQDKLAFGGGFHGGAWNLDDAEADDSFAFASDARADFGGAHEALFISAAVSRLAGPAAFAPAGAATLLAAINRIGVVAGVGEDGLLVVQAGASTGVYYYAEADGKAGAALPELSLLAVLDARAGSGDFTFG